MPTLSGRRQIQRTKRFGRDVRKLPEHIQKEAFHLSNQLAEDIFDRNLNLKQLTGFRGVFRVVVVRDYRMIFSFDDENIYLLKIAHRREIYRNLEL